MKLEFPIIVKYRDESYSLFLSNGDSVYINISEESATKMYRKHTGMQSYENFINAICQINSIVTSDEFEKAIIAYEKHESEFFNKERSKANISIGEQAEIQFN